MSILVSFRTLFYCFVFGFVFSAIYHIFNRLIYRFYYILKLFLLFVLGVCFSYCFFIGLIYINDGILRIYFLMFLFMGYVFFQKYYSFILIYYLEKYVRIYRRIIKPFIFFFKRIDAIMRKKVKWVKKKWQKRKNSKSENL